jgi:hypothetical protein
MCTNYENGKEWRPIYNCFRGQTLVELHIDTPDERVDEVATELENEPTFYQPVNLVYDYDRNNFKNELLRSNPETHVPRSEE